MPINLYFIRDSFGFCESLWLFAILLVVIFFLSFYFLVLEPKQMPEYVVKQKSGGMSTCHVYAITTKCQSV